ncbi:MAG TPA: hypothetical protein DCE44_01980 [Verrucomicrobiales bacterium]|nr:hypothetical protein [Verrucomicrobiales bacterium]
MAGVNPDDEKNHKFNWDAPGGDRSIAGGGGAPLRPHNRLSHESTELKCAFAPSPGSSVTRVLNRTVDIFGLGDASLASLVNLIKFA